MNPSTQHSPSSPTGSTSAVYFELARLGRALANPARLLLMDELEGKELSVEELAKATGLTVKNTSAQLQELRGARLVEARRDGTRIFYRTASPAVSAFLGRFHNFAHQTLAELRAEVTKHLGTADQLEPVTASALAKLMKDGNITVVDVRPAADFARAHIPGALSMPSADLSRHLDRLSGTEPIVAYCQGPYCLSSPDAVRTLHNAGLQARVLHGGWTAWERAQAERFAS